MRAAVLTTAMLLATNAHALRGGGPYDKGGWSGVPILIGLLIWVVCSHKSSKEEGKRIVARYKQQSMELAGRDITQADINATLKALEAKGDYESVRDIVQARTLYEQVAVVHRIKHK